jgi:hypothetical protein
MQSCRVGRWYLNGFTSKYHADQVEELETDGMHQNKLVPRNCATGRKIPLPQFCEPMRNPTRGIDISRFCHPAPPISGFRPD